MIINEDESHLRVFENRSEYIANNQSKEIFLEGPVSSETQKRIKLIKESFEQGFLENIITDIPHPLGILLIFNHIFFC